MQEKDIQELFAYIKARLNGRGTAPRLTKSVAAEWCKCFDGYTLAQLKEAVDQQTFLKPSFWPDPGELMARLPAMSTDGNRYTQDPFRTNGYRDEVDYISTLQGLIRRGRELE